MAEYREAFIGIDVAKVKNSLAIAEAGRDGEVRHYGDVDASLSLMRRTISKLAAKYDRLHFCYEAGPTGYGLHRLIANRIGEFAPHRGEGCSPAALEGDPDIRRHRHFLADKPS